MLSKDKIDFDVQMTKQWLKQTQCDNCLNNIGVRTCKAFVVKPLSYTNSQIKLECPRRITK